MWTALGIVVGLAAPCIFGVLELSLGTQSGVNL
jgi:hypothetical protein